MLDAIVVALVLDCAAGRDARRVVERRSSIVLGLAAVTTDRVSTVLALDDDAWFEASMARRARRRAGDRHQTDVPGVVFVQIDGLAKPVLDRALRSGDVPTLHRWLRDGSHRLIGWETGWSSQTGVSQCGILHGSVVDMPAFRWVDKSTGAVVVSNHPASAAAIERAPLRRRGPARPQRVELRQPVLRRRRARRDDDERDRQAQGGPRRRRLLRLLLAATARRRGRSSASSPRSVRERVAAWQQVRHGVEPRVARGWSYAVLRARTRRSSAATSTSLGVLNDMCEGRAAIYIDMLGYDEVSHHSGPERADALAVLRDIDRQIGRIERAVRFAPRPYRVVVLSDHGQTQGAPFAERAGETLAELVARLCGSAASGDSDAEAGRTESSAWLRRGSRRASRSRTPPPSPRRRSCSARAASG